MYLWKYPLSFERQYQKQLSALVNNMKKVVNNNKYKIKAYLEKYRIDNEESELDNDIRNMIIEYELLIAADFIERKVAEMFDNINSYNANEFRKSLGVDIFANEEFLNATKDLWVKENMQLITSVKNQYFERIENIISNAVRNGTTYADVSEQIAKQTGLSLNRSRLIARDQIGTLNGQITKQRQTSAGVTKYRWSTSKDERVRPDHQVREGKIFEWSKPPFDGHPGMAISCRCVAIPIIDSNVK